MADQPRSDKSLPTLASELWDLVRAYAKQETIEPIKGAGPLRRLRRRRLARSSASALALLALGLLRVLQSETGDVFDGNWSFAPYVITRGGLRRRGRLRRWPCATCRRRAPQTAPARSAA